MESRKGPMRNAGRGFPLWSLTSLPPYTPTSHQPHLKPLSVALLIIPSVCSDESLHGWKKEGFNLWLRLRDEGGRNRWVQPGKDTWSQGAQVRPLPWTGFTLLNEIGKWRGRPPAAAPHWLLAEIRAPSQTGDRELGDMGHGHITAN